MPRYESVTPPEDPYSCGYMFVKWIRILGSVESNMIISPIFRRLEEQYTVTVSGGKLSTGETEGQYQFDIPIEVVADEPVEGMKFSHWLQDGIKVSTKSIIYFVSMRY